MEVNSAPGSMITSERRVRHHKLGDFVTNSGIKHHHALQTGFRGAPAEVTILVIHEGSRVEQSDLLENLSPDQQTTACNPVCFHGGWTCGQRWRRCNSPISPPVENPTQKPGPRRPVIFVNAAPGKIRSCPFRTFNQAGQGLRFNNGIVVEKKNPGCSTGQRISDSEIIAASKA